ncbi:MAG: hypothetical protein FWH20_02295 [Oscillospiraceae bacterium]|nr:hypothetical protein [Oscillospiraceae bacterium]
MNCVHCTAHTQVPRSPVNLGVGGRARWGCGGTRTAFAREFKRGRGVRRHKNRVHCTTFAREFRHSRQGAGVSPTASQDFAPERRKSRLNLTLTRGGIKPPFKTYEVREMQCEFFSSDMRG